MKTSLMVNLNCFQLSYGICWRVLRILEPLSDRWSEVSERWYLRGEGHRERQQADLPVCLPHRILTLLLRGGSLGQRLPQQPLQQRRYLHPSLKHQQLHMLMSGRVER